MFISFVSALFYNSLRWRSLGHYMTPFLERFYHYYCLPAICLVNGSSQHVKLYYFCHSVCFYFLGFQPLISMIPTWRINCMIACLKKFYHYYLLPDSCLVEVSSHHMSWKYGPQKLWAYEEVWLVFVANSRSWYGLFC